MVLDKRVEMCLLMDFYGSMLTVKQRNIMHKYYEQDISLVEIGDEEGISRQAVRDALITSEKVLNTCEEKLGFVSKHNVLKNSIDEIINDIDSNIDKVHLIKKLKSLSKNL